MFATTPHLGYISAHAAQRAFHYEPRTIAEDE
jgi:hypothetical protein